MTDLRSLDSAPDSHFDFESLKKDREEESALEKDIDPMKLIERDYERQKRGLPPAFGGSSNSSQFKNIKSEQFSLRGKAATSTMASLHGGPIRINKLAEKKDISETPEKMDDCSMSTDEAASAHKSPRSGKTKPMPDTSEIKESTTQGEHKVKIIRKGSIRKSKGKTRKENKNKIEKSAFSYNESNQYDEVKQDLKPKFSSQDEQENTSKNNQIFSEVKELRLKIRQLENEKRALKEESIKIKQECSDEMRRALTAGGSDDKKVELLQLELGELET